MKKLFFLLLAILPGMQALSQKASIPFVPAKVAEAFKARHPDVTKVTWEEEEGGYEATFEKGNLDMATLFDKDGNWLQTETEMKTSGLPEAVRTTLNREFNGYALKEANQVESREFGNCFEADIEKNGKHMDVMVSPEGKLLRVTEEAEERED